MSKFYYRPDIDGLRALAVMGVVLFHAGLGIPGGYVGVDVFFVISGFLITTVILKDMEAGCFSMPQFWGRRIRRILPAVSVMVFGVLVAGGLFLDSGSFYRLAKEALAQSVMLSNVHFLGSIGYFAEGAEYKPLLHTWSLAVEEQFYLIYPVLLWLVYRVRRKRVAAVLLGVAAASFGLSVYGMRHNPSATFFLLPARAWELMAGAVVAITQGDYKVRRRPAEMVSFAGIVMILAAMCCLTRLTPFPGVAALFPVVGTMLVIVGNKDHATIVSRLLSVQPIVFVGLISYSLYLWHWPILVFARLMIIEITPVVKAVAMAASFLLAVWSWKYVEQPFRNPLFLKKRSSVFIFGLVATLAVVIPSTIVAKFDGFPSRLDENDRRMTDDIAWNGSVYKTKNKGKPIGAIRPSGGDAVSYDFALWGDSHGLAVADLVNTLAARDGLSGLAFLRAGLPPVTGVWPARSEAASRQEIERKSLKILDELISRKIRHVILVGRWSGMCEGLNSVERAEDQKADPQGPMVVNRVNDEVTPENSARVLRVQLGGMLQRLEGAGITVWILKQVPEADQGRIARNFYLSKRFACVNRLNRTSTSYAAHQARQARANAVLDALASERIHVIDPAPFFFPGGDPLVIYAERAFYRDEDHLTRTGAETFLTPVMAPIFKQIAGEKREAASGFVGGIFY